MIQLAYAPRGYHTLNLLGEADDSAPVPVPAWVGTQLWRVYKSGLYPAIENATALGIPAALLLGWPAFESSWLIGSHTKYDERGYFQLMPAESAKIGVDHQSLSTDPQASFDAGVALIQEYRNEVANDGFSESNPDLFWPMVKFYHTIGAGGARAMISMMRNDGIEPTTWSDVEDYVANNPGLYPGGHSADKWVPVPGKVMSKGNLLAMAGKFKLYTNVGGVPVVALGVGLVLGLGVIFGVRAIKRRRAA